MGSPVEIEYAFNLDEDSGKPTFYILQLKPLIRTDRGGDVDIGTVLPADCLIRSERSMGNGRIEGLRDVVWLDPGRFDRSRTRDIAAEVEAFDKRLKQEGRRYILLGFGRWGTRYPWLGVPVAYSQIAQASVIVEADLPGFRVDSSLGSHFFHKVTSMNIGYFTAPLADGESAIDWDWLARMPRKEESEHCVWTSLEEPLDVLMDGRASKAVVLKNKRLPPPPAVEPELDSIE